MLLTPMTVVVLVACGMGAALLGSIKLALARKLEIDEARVGGLVSMFGLAMIPVVLSAGFITDLVGKQPVVIGGSVLMAVSLVMLGTVATYWGAVAGVLVLSASWSALINVINPVSVIAFGGDKTYAMNLACFFFGVGAFVTPLAVAFLLRRMGITKGLMLIAGLLLVPVALSFGVDFAALSPVAAEAAEAAETKTVAAGMGTLLADPVMWLCTLAFLFYGPLEGSTGAWTTTYLTDKGVSEGKAAGLLSAFWLSYTASRLVTAMVVKAVGMPTGGDRVLILVFAVATVAVLSGIVRSRGPRSAIVMVICTGIIFGPLYPTIMAVLLGHFDPSVHGRAVGLFFSIGGIGMATIPAAMGAYAKRTSVQRGFLVGVGSAVCLVVVALVLVLGG